MAAAIAAGPQPPAPNQFANPVLGHGQDPSVVVRGGWYYYTQTSLGQHYITIRRSRSLRSLAAARRIVVWRGGRSGSPCCQWWAPELHLINRRWYIYASADDGRNGDHRLQVLQSARPLGPYRYLGRLATPGNHWSIDPSPLKLPDGRLFLFWSGWGERSGRVQSIYVAAMRSPWSVGAKRTRLSTPTYAWERHSGWLPSKVNESPEPIIHGSTISVTYSASGCWTPYYALGLLSARLGSNLMRRESWTKSPAPIFHSDVGAGIYGAASNGWFSSPNGQQTWQVFNAVRDPRGSCGPRREVYAQPVTWNPDGTPNLGQQPAVQPLDLPSGDPGAR